MCFQVEELAPVTTPSRLGPAEDSAVLASHVEQRDDAGMMQGTGRPRFGFEVGTSIGIACESFRQDLDRDVTTESRVLRAIHLPHSTAA